MDIGALKKKLSDQIIEYLNLSDLPEGIVEDEPLFAGSLGLDSIDSIELVVLLEREYGIKIEDPQTGRKVLVDINTMANYIVANSKVVSSSDG